MPRLLFFAEQRQRLLHVGLESPTRGGSAAPAQGPVLLHVASVAQRPEVGAVEHQALFLRRVQPVLDRRDVVHLDTGRQFPACLAVLANRVLGDNLAS